MAIIYCALILTFFKFCVSDYLCPKQCDCDMVEGLNRATCVNQNIVSVDVGVPKFVQVYSLSHNVITELDNFCFKELGYNSIQVLNLSYNLIFWVGLHAFHGLERLANLNLSNNRLRYIPPDVFWDTPELTELDLSGNIFESLKNEPFISHTKLQILNLNSCRIKSLLNRLFTRVPNLKKLDLSDNYMISLNTEVLQPLRKLERLEIRNEYWVCNSDFLAVEKWIASHGIVYKKQCVKKQPNMFEKMISVVKMNKTEVDITNIWNVTETYNDTSVISSVEPKKPLSPFEKFDKEFSAVQAFIIGVEIGLAIGIVATYLWLRVASICRINCRRPLTRRQRRRAQRNADSEMRASLIWNSVLNLSPETPPLYRRQLSPPDRNLPFATYGMPDVREPPIHADAVRMPDRSETPPPPYHECRISL